jgi:hypothetical protein
VAKIENIFYYFFLFQKAKLYYYRDFYVDKIGLTVKVAETAISEGWQVPK